MDTMKSLMLRAERARARQSRVIADGKVMTHLGRTYFTRKEAEEMARDLRNRGYDAVARHEQGKKP
jgi:hypothetical protein